MSVPAERIADLIGELERSAEPAIRERVRELVAAVLELHRAALVRVLALGDAETLAADEAVALVLALHGLHPRALAARIEAALDELHLHDQGLEVTLDGLDGDVARVQVRARGQVRARADAVRATIESAVVRAAPEIAAVEIAGLDESDVPLSRLARVR